jgi:hypothetical protein
MDGGSFEADGIEVIDVARYKSDLNYRRRIHEDLQIAGDDTPIDLDFEEDGEEPAFNSADYPTEEAVREAMRKFMDDILEEVRRDAAARNRVPAARP